jgi:hypothetical protein
LLKILKLKYMLPIRRLMDDSTPSSETTVLKGHTLLRCYANGMPYGTEGTLHTDSVSESGHTTSIIRTTNGSRTGQSMVTQEQRQAPLGDSSDPPELIRQSLIKSDDSR